MTVMPGDTAALRPCAALTLGDSNTHSSEEVISKDSQNCLEVMGVQRLLGIPGGNRGGPGAQGCELLGILRAVRTARLHLMSTAGGVGRVRQKSTGLRPFTAE